MSEKELSPIEKAKREINLVEWSITTVTITAQAHERMYHTEGFPANYAHALAFLQSQLTDAMDRLKELEES